MSSGDSSVTSPTRSSGPHGRMCRRKPNGPARRRTASSDGAPLGEAATLLAPLAFAQDALARLDARAEAAPARLRDGLIARLAFREAESCLTAEHAWVHPHDLALRDLLLTGGFDAAVRAGVPAHTCPTPSRAVQPNGTTARTRSPPSSTRPAWPRRCASPTCRAGTAR